MTAQSHNPARRPRQKAFTLVEMLVVIAIVVLTLGITLPTIMSLLTSSSEGQARSAISALLGTARALAVERQTYTLVHFQMGTKWEGNQYVSDGQCWAAVLMYDKRERIYNEPDDEWIDPNPTHGQFIPVEGYPPRLVPGGFAVGEVSARWVGGSMHFGDGSEGAIGDELEATEVEPRWDFTAFNVVFAPDGSVSELVPDTDGNLLPPDIQTDDCFLFTDADHENIWRTNGVTVDEEGVRMMVLFAYKAIKNLNAGDYDNVLSRAGYLQNQGSILYVNPYTGQLIVSEAE